MIVYSKTSFAGVPQFSYKDAELDLNFSSDEITQQDTPLGEIVTVTLENLIPVDGPLRTFTLLVPKIRLRRGDEISFDTLGIETIDSPAHSCPRVRECCRPTGHTSSRASRGSSTSDHAPALAPLRNKRSEYCMTRGLSSRGRAAVCSCAAASEHPVALRPSTPQSWIAQRRPRPRGRRLSAAASSPVGV